MSGLRIRWFLPALTTLLYSGLGLAAPVSLVDAIQWTLAKNPNIQLQEKQTDTSLGALQQAAGQFDTTASLAAGYDSDHAPLTQQSQQSYLAQGFPLSQLQTDTTSYSVALNKPLRNGVVLSPSISATRTEGTSNDLSKLAAQNRGKVNFNILIPLQQGRRESASLGEAAATLTWEASKQDLRFAIAQGIYGTVSAYWKWVAARKYAAIAQEAEASTRHMAEETQKLIEAEEIPAADLLLVQASLLDKTSARIAAEQTLLDALQKLGQSIGLTAAQIASLEPLDEFPAPPVALPVFPPLRTGFVDAALRRRADLAAARLRQEAARTSEKAAGHSLQPQLDLNIRVGYATLVEGNANGNLASAATQNRTDANIGTTISYQWPVENSIARGRYLQQAAAYAQSVVQVDTLERSIGLGVEAALSALVGGVMQVQRSEESVALYRVTVENEKTKRQLGNSTLIDVLSVNDRYLAARQNNITYRLNYLNALAQLSYETGALLVDDPSGPSIRFETFTTVPTLD